MVQQVSEHISTFAKMSKGNDKGMVIMCPTGKRMFAAGHAQHDIAEHLVRRA